MESGTATAREPAWTVITPSRGWLPRFDAGELWSYRGVVTALARRDLKLAHKQAVLGLAWAFIRPLAGAVVFSFVFGRLVDVPSDGLPYPVFVFSGLIVWSYISTAVEAAAGSLVSGRDLITHIYFPRVLAPLAGVLTGMIDLAVSLGGLGVFLVIYDVAPSAALALAPVWIVGALLLSLGVGLWLSALNAQYRDVGHALTYLLQLWFFATPVVYPTSLFQGADRYLISLNPATWVIDGARWSLAAGPAPEAADLLSLGICLSVLASGLVYFRRVERVFADVV
jgi:lipopolysaccharide transport system permease protein